MARDKIYSEEEFPSPLLQLWHNFKETPVVMIGLSCFIFLTILALFSPLITPYSAVENHLDYLLLPPAWHNDGNVSFLLGTDNLGRDMLSRLMHGTSLTFGLSFVVVLISLVIAQSAKATSKPSSFRLLRIFTQSLLLPDRQASVRLNISYLEASDTLSSTFSAVMGFWA